MDAQAMAEALVSSDPRRDFVMIVREIIQMDKAYERGNVPGNNAARIVLRELLRNAGWRYRHFARADAEADLYHEIVATEII